MAAVNQETVLSVHHWNETLFSFTTTRSAGLRFRNGHFVLLGLELEGRPLLRAYSLVSANYDEHLEFYSIKVPDGALTSKLQHVKPGDPILVGKKATGTLIVDNLKPGKNLYLLSTGTGLAPFLSIVRDFETYERFEKVILVHGVRRVADLAYRQYLESELPNHELIGESVRNQLVYYPTVTREPFRNQGRISDLLASGTLSANVGLPPLDPAHDRVMLCGSPAMLTDLTGWLENQGFGEGSSGEMGEYVIEKAFVEK